MSLYQFAVKQVRKVQVPFDLVLESITWTKDRHKIEVHNPTAAAITATVSSPVEIQGLKRLEKQVIVPAGSTIYVE